MKKLCTTVMVALLPLIMSFTSCSKADGPVDDTEKGRVEISCKRGSESSLTKRVSYEVTVTSSGIAVDEVSAVGFNYGQDEAMKNHEFKILSTSMSETVSLSKGVNYLQGYIKLKTGDKIKSKVRKLNVN